METIQILDEFEMLRLSGEALKYTRENISTDNNQNWDIIYNLKLDLLVKEQSMIQERKRLMEQAKKREEVIEQLKRQIR